MMYVLVHEPAATESRRVNAALLKSPAPAGVAYRVADAELVEPYPGRVLTPATQAA